jgi:predicted transcriptional regulator
MIRRERLEAYYEILKCLEKNGETRKTTIMNEVGLHVGYLWTCMNNLIDSKLCVKIFRQMNYAHANRRILSSNPRTYRHPFYVITEKGKQYIKAFKNLKELMKQ